MKKIVYAFLCSLLIACGDGSTKKKEGFQFNRTKKEISRKETAKSATPIDLNNTGIGPIKDFAFKTDIDQNLVKIGATVFKQKCTACHKIDAKLIGPAMKGIYERRHPAWVMNLLLNPTEMLQKDPIAKALLAEYNNILMINQNLNEEEAKAIAEYLRTL